MIPERKFLFNFENVVFTEIQQTCQDKNSIELRKSNMILSFSWL